MSTQKKSLIGTLKAAKKVQVAAKAETKGAKNVSARAIQSNRAVHAKKSASLTPALGQARGMSPMNHNQTLL